MLQGPGQKFSVALLEQLFMKVEQHKHLDFAALLLTLQDSLDIADHHLCPFNSTHCISVL